MVKDNIIIKEVVTNAYTVLGEMTVKKLGFEYPQEHQHYGKIYKIEFKALLSMMSQVI